MKWDKIVKDYNISIYSDRLEVLGKRVKEYTFVKFGEDHKLDDFGILRDHLQGMDINEYIFTNVYSYLKDLAKGPSFNSGDISETLRVVRHFPKPEDVSLLKFLNSSNDDYFAVDSKTGEPLTEIEGKAYFDHLQSVLPVKEFKSFRSEKVVPCLTTYNPLNEKRIIHAEKEGEPVVFYNTYTPPYWQRRTDLVHTGYPKLFTKLLEHLVPDNDQRKQVRKFFYQVIYKKSTMHLLLHGYKGTGKSTIVSVISQVCGKGNYINPPHMESQFDSGLKNKKLVFWDELNFKDRNKKDRLKKYINNETAYEEKHVKTHKTVRNYASHIIANNNESSVNLEIDDRIFLIPDLAVDNLNTVMNEEELKYLNNLEGLDDDFLFNIAKSLEVEFKDDLGPLKKIVSDTYKKLVISSLRPYQKAIYHLCKTHEKFGKNEILSEMKNHLDHIQKNITPRFRKDYMVSFLEDFKRYLGIDLCSYEFVLDSINKSYDMFFISKVYEPPSEEELEKEQLKIKENVKEFTSTYNPENCTGPKGDNSIFVGDGTLRFDL